MHRASLWPQQVCSDTVNPRDPMNWIVLEAATMLLAIGLFSLITWIIIIGVLGP